MKSPPEFQKLLGTRGSYLQFKLLLSTENTHFGSLWITGSSTCENTYKGEKITPSDRHYFSVFTIITHATGIPFALLLRIVIAFLLEDVAGES